MSELMRIPFHRALHRSNLIFGGEREWMILCLGISAILMITSMNIPSFLVGVVFAAVSVTGLRAMAKADPLMSKVYRRQVWYRDYYPNYSRPSRVANPSLIKEY
jgi:type IV secretion system protein TrbD